MKKSYLTNQRYRQGCDNVRGILWSDTSVRNITNTVLEGHSKVADIWPMFGLTGTMPDGYLMSSHIMLCEPSYVASTHDQNFAALVAKGSPSWTQQLNIFLQEYASAEAPMCVPENPAHTVICPNAPSTCCNVCVRRVQGECVCNVCLCRVQGE